MTLLNYVTKFKFFIFQTSQLDRKKNKLLIAVIPRKNSRPLCSGQPGAVYDHLKQREFLLPPIWNIMVVLLNAMRRVDCKKCGKVVVEQVPWSTGSRCAGSMQGSCNRQRTCDKEGNEKK